MWTETVPVTETALRFESHKHTHKHTQTICLLRNLHAESAFFVVVVVMGDS